MSALVGCVLVGAGKNDQEASEKLISKLENKSPKEQEKIINSCSKTDVVIYDLTVGFWAELCKKSPQKCSVQQLKDFRSLSWTGFSSYVKHCEAKVRRFCTDHIDKVVDHFTKTSENRKLMASFVKYYRESDSESHNNDKNPFNQDPPAYSVVDAYFKLMEAKCGRKGTSSEQQDDFLKKVRHIANIYLEIGHLLHELSMYDLNNPTISLLHDAAAVSAYFVGPRNLAKKIGHISLADYRS